jgi:RNA polymerase primary sigma factor
METQRPEQIIDLVNRMMRASRQMLPEIHREPTPAELAEKMAIPVEKVNRLLEIARTPITLKT